MIFRLLATSLLWLGASADTPLQGVFTTSNNAVNEVGVYSIKQDDGSLEWVGAYKTGGLGYPTQPVTGFAAWTGSNCISYHVWNKQQWLLASNEGGENFESSLSIFKINKDLSLELTDNVPAVVGTWAESVTGVNNRACIHGTGTTVLVNCFKITEEGKLVDKYEYDLEVNVLIDLAIRGHSDAPSLQFSPDGSKLGVLFKGSVNETWAVSRTFTDNNPEVIEEGAFYVFPVTDDGYDEPLKLEISANRRPYDFVWSPTSTRFWTVGLPTGLDPTYQTDAGNIMAVDIIDGEFSEIGHYNYGFKAGCWIEYYNSYLYASNFVIADDLSIFLTNDDGSVDLSTKFDYSFGTGTAPVDLAISGATASGVNYLYTQLSAVAQIHAASFKDDGNLTEIGRYPIPGTGGAGPDPAEADWTFNAGVASTLSSYEELEALFAEPTSAPTSETTSAPTSSASAMSAFGALAASLMVLLL